MPVIKMEIAALTKEQKKNLALEITQSASKNTGIPAEAFYMFFEEYPKDNISIGGKLMGE